ncbi:tyrosine-type recombinase/integrase [Ferrovibrio sp.]|uniref:tyrosine-type recombinase/integrase n=1 Tax=Ferrovibrio sp. TaxID=1917215 RepID=UPI003D0CDFD8
MTKSGTRIRHLVARRNSDGALRFYWSPSATLKAAGFAVVRLHGDLADAAAQAEAWNRKADDFYKGVEPAKAPASKSIAGLIALFLGAPAFKELGPRSRADHTYYLGMLENYAGDVPYASFSRIAAEDWLFKVKEKHGPTMRFHCYSTARRLYSWAEQRGVVTVNPFSKLDVPTPSRRAVTWRLEHLAIMQQAAVAAGRPSMALACAMAFYLMQREADVLHMLRSADDGEVMTFKQRKTGKDMEIHIHPELRSWISKTPKSDTAMTFVVDEATGRPYNEHTFRRRFAEIRAAAGIPKELQFMDLRRSGATYLGESGGTEDEIASMTGHENREMLAIYVKKNRRFTQNAVVKMADYAAATTKKQGENN